MAHWIDTKSSHPGSRFGGWMFTSLLARVIETIEKWQSRASERHHLMTMDDRMLKDIGVTRSEAHEEARKPFWAD